MMVNGTLLPFFRPILPMHPESVRQFALHN